MSHARSLFAPLSASDRALRQRAAHTLLHDAGVLPVVTIESPDQALAIGRALLAGGLSAIEVTLRSAAAIPALALLKKQLPQLRIGAGTVRTAGQVESVVQQGADFIVTPGLPGALAVALIDCPVPVIPGGATVTEFMTLLDCGFSCAKFFPAVPAGGLPFIRSLAGPIPDLSLCPTGGISEATAGDFLIQPNVVCIGGSWMVPGEWVAQGRFDEIARASRRARDLVDAARGKRS